MPEIRLELIEDNDRETDIEFLKYLIDLHKLLENKLSEISSTNDSYDDDDSF